VKFARSRFAGSICTKHRE